MARGWLNGAVLVGLAVAGAAGASRRTPSLVLEPRGAEALAALEVQAARSPDDEAAVGALARALLDRGEPGMALAALERSPGLVQSSPEVSDLTAVALVSAGRNRQALAVTRQALSWCDRRPCGASLVARAVRREEWLDAAVAAGIEDMSKNPEGAMLAYRRAVREVRLAMK